MSVVTPTASAEEERPTRAALLWLAGLGSLFYISYGGANWLASLHAHVPAIAFAWERQVPFLDWTILPYWSTNAFYAASVFVCATRRELDTHVRRLLTAQIVAVICFIIVPLRFSWPKPDTSGLFGFLFAALGAFDKPFNQAPSLHVALTVILWSLYVRHLPRRVLPLFHAWSALVVASVMTTFQHHFVDIPTGALLGLFCVWTWPWEGEPPLARLSLTRCPDRLWLARYYGAGAVTLATVVIAAFSLGADGAWLWLLWLAFALAMVASGYAAIGPALFQKRRDGGMSVSARLLLAPYRLCAFVNSRLWTYGDAKPALIAEGLHIGRFPTSAELRRGKFRCVVDLTAEFAAPRFASNLAGRWQSVPMLDLVAPPPDALIEAATAIERARPQGPILVCCALGYGRSVAAVATWLIRSGRARDVAEAAAQLKAARPRLALSRAQLAAIAEAVREP
ncbi:Dual specificity phosphatase, catalytic domain [Rhizobiales bacterium GAS113]|nr:Dual specificity phosphatase, catalytic domain [Rhizobiales bacterium GAS113]